MNPIILIPARLKSTRLPDKPLADIAGKPMIVRVMEQAQKSGVGPVYVACDDKTIADAVRKADGNAVMTQTTHESGSDRIYEALLTIDPDGRHDVIINVQGDVPTIDPALIRTVLEPLLNPAVDMATLACLITDPDEGRDPAVVKPVFVSDPTQGQTVIQAKTFTRTRLDNGPLYHHIGIYAYRRSSLMRFVSLPPSPQELRERLEQLRAIEAGMRIDVALVDTAPLGVDTPEHLERARKIVKERMG